MKRFEKVGLWIAAICVGTAVAAGGTEKKMIGHSWDLLAVRPADVARNLEAWQKLPLDVISLALVEPENRVKYQTQVLAGFGLYLDMYANPTNSPWYFDRASCLPLGGVGQTRKSGQAFSGRRQEKGMVTFSRYAR